MSYPNSGSAWLCSLLARCLNAESIDLDESETETSHATRQILKTHKSSGLNLHSEPIVYLVRDGRDVVMSYYLQRVAANRQSIEKTASSNTLVKTTRRLTNKVEAFMEDAAISALVRQHAIDWSNHIKVWLQRQPVAIVRYEDLLAVPEETIASLVLPLGTKTSSEVIRQAIDTSSSNRLLNAVPGEWQKRFSQNHVQTFQHIAGESLKLLGYDI